MATTTVLTASASQVFVGMSVTFTASVTPASGAAIPAGTMTFSDGSNVLGAVTLDGTGKATYTTSQLVARTHNITAAYSGATTFGISSATLTFPVNSLIPVDFSLTLTPAASTVTAGSSALTTVALAPLGGFKAATTLGCTGAPLNSLCSFSATTLTPADGVTAVSANLTLQTSVQTALLVENDAGVRLAGIIPQGLLGRGMLAFSLRVRGRWAARATRLSLLCALIALSGCGGKGNPAAAATTAYAAKGTYPLTVTATSGSIVHTATFTVTVQ